MANLVTSDTRGNRVDFLSKDAKRLTQYWKVECESYRSDYDKEWQRAYQDYYGWVDMTNRDPNLLWAFIPKPYANIESRHADNIKVMLGSEPYFPIKAKNKFWQPAADALANLTTGLCNESDFFVLMAKCLKISALTGCCMMHPSWRFQPKKVRRAVPKYVGGKKISESYVDEMIIEQGFQLRYVAPWLTGVDSWHPEIMGKGRVYYEVIPTSLTALRQHMKLAPNAYDIKPSELQDPKQYSTGSVGTQEVERMRYGADNRLDEDMVNRYCFWFEQVGRYVETINCEQVIKDRKDWEVPLRAARFANIDDPYPNTFYSMGDNKPIEKMIHIANDSLSQLLNAQQQSIDRVFAYREGYFNPYDLVTTPGARWRIPEDVPVGQIDDYIKEFKSQPLGRDAYELLDRIDKYEDDGTGRQAYNRGEMPERRETATVAMELMDSSDARTQVALKMQEVGGTENMVNHMIDILAENMHLALPLAQEILQDQFRFLNFDLETNKLLKLREFPGGAMLKLKGAAQIAGEDKRFERRVAKYDRFIDRVPNPAGLTEAMMEGDDDFSQEEIKKTFEVQQQPAANPVDQMGGGNAMTPVQPGQMSQAG